MRYLKQVLAITIMMLMISCGGLHFSAASYNDDLAVRNKAIELIRKSGESYTTHQAEVDALKSDVLRIVENEKKRKGNGTTVAMWNEVITGKGNLFDLLNVWKSNNQLTGAMASQAAPQVERLLNSIADLENFKKK